MILRLVIGSASSSGGDLGSAESSSGWKNRCFPIGNVGKSGLGGRQYSRSRGCIGCKSGVSQYEKKRKGLA